MSVRQQIYNQLPNPSEIEDLMADLGDVHRDHDDSMVDIANQAHELCDKAHSALRDCLNKFHAIMKIADALPVIPHRPLQED